MSSVLRKSLWYGRLAWTRFVREPRTFLGAVRRALSVRASARAAEADAPRCEVQPICFAPDVVGRVSLVLPVYNQADLLGAAIESVLGQTWSDLELIVLDDGSTDEIEPVLARALHDPRVRVLRQPNRGLPAALTAGFAGTTGEFVGWTSADNLLEPDMVELLATKLRADDGLTMVYADYTVIDGEGDPLLGGDFRPLQRSGPGSAEVRLPRSAASLGTHADNFIGPCFLYRGWVRRAFPEWRGALGVEDWDYWLRLHAGFRIAHLGSDAVPYRYRWHSNSLNARATSIRLLDKAEALLAEEGERRVWRQQPLEVQVQRELVSALEAPDPHRVAVMDVDSGRAASSRRDGVRSLSVVAGELWASACRAGRGDGEGLRVVLWDAVPDEESPIPHPQVLHVLLRRPSAAARISPSTPLVCVPDGPRALGQFVCAWADAVGPPSGRSETPVEPAPKPWSPPV